MSRPATSRLKANPALGQLPVLQYCSPEQLQIDDDYQRSMEGGRSQALVRRIAMHWDWGLCQPLFVARRGDGGLFVVDGQHRLAAAKLRGDIWQLPCVVASFATAADEAASFVALNQQRRPLTQLEIFKAALAAGDDEARKLVRLIDEAGLKLSNHGSNTLMKTGHICNIGGLQRVMRISGEHALSIALAVLAGAYPGQVLRYAGSIFPGIAAVVADEIRLRTSREDLIERLTPIIAASPQMEWFRRFGRANANDPNLNRQRAAEQVIRGAWRERYRPEIGIAPKAEPTVSLSATYLKPNDQAWCAQCEQRVSGEHAASCASSFCSLKVKAAA